MSDRSHGDGPDRQPTRVTLFLFATGIENSYPTIQNGRIRRDEMEECGHYDQWQRDFELLGDLNIRFLRYGPPLHKTFLGQGRYDWEFTDLTFAWLKERDDHSHRRPVPFRRARLDRRLPEPGLPSAVCRVRPRLRASLPLGPVLHPGQRDVHLRPVLGRLRLVERAIEERPSLRHRTQAHRQGERAGHVSPFSTSVPMRFSSRASRPSISTPTIRRPSSPRSPTTRDGSCRST